MGNYCCFAVARSGAEYKAKGEFNKLTDDPSSDPWNRAVTNLVNKSQNLVIDGKRTYHKHETSKLLEKNKQKSNEIREKYKQSNTSKSADSTTIKMNRDKYNSLRDTYKAKTTS